VSYIDLRKKEKNDEYLEKNRNSIFFCVFLKINFSARKVLFRPHFSEMVRGIELELFPNMLDTIWRAHFFFISKNIALVIFGSFYKICDSKKTSFFKGVFGIFAFLFERQKI
jgi:hypothetical protein